MTARVLVGVKRVIDYAVKVRFFSFYHLLSNSEEIHPFITFIFQTLNFSPAACHVIRVNPGANSKKELGALLRTQTPVILFVCSVLLWPIGSYLGLDLNLVSPAGRLNKAKLNFNARSAGIGTFLDGAITKQTLLPCTGFFFVFFLLKCFLRKDFIFCCFFFQLSYFCHLAVLGCSVGGGCQIGINNLSWFSKTAVGKQMYIKTYNYLATYVIFTVA